MAELRLEEVRKGRPSKGGGRVEILRGVTLTARCGELTVIIGPSGGGKSTLVRLINRLEDCDGGRILLDGTDILETDPLLLRRQVALVSQKPFMFNGTVLENLQSPFDYRGEDPPEGGSAEITRVLDLCRLEADILSRDARTLSLGQQQRVSLARALVTGPQVLLLDEPTSALDRPTGDRLGDTLREIARKEGMTVLMVTHDLRLAELIADRLAYLEGGYIHEEGPTEDLLHRPRTEALRRFLDQPQEGGG
jgi:putative ABC transport system ATP-binding protein